MMTQFVKVPIMQQRTPQEDIVDAGEAFVARARQFDVPVVVGIAIPGQVYITAHTNILTPEELYRLIISLSPRQHPSVLTLPCVEDIMKRLEQDVQDLEAAGVPFVCGIQPDNTGKLKIFSHFPVTTVQALISAHLDLTVVDPDMFGDTEEMPC